MTYIDLINRFWQRFEEEEISRTEMALYFYLLNVCNKRRWQSKFSLTNKNIMVNLNISENTLAKSRDRLVELDLIKCEKGERNGFSPRYTIVGVEEENSEVSYDANSDVNNEDECEATNDVSSDVSSEVNTEAKTEANSEANKGVKSLARIRNHACKNKTKIKNKIKTKDYFNSSFGS